MGSDSVNLPARRAPWLRAGIRVEMFTLGWMVVEATVAIGAGVLARSALLTAFGIDSVLELVSGAILLWRLVVEARAEVSANSERDEVGERIERVERRATLGVAIALALLCVYVLATALYGLIVRARPDASLVGILIAMAALVVMPVLGVTKRRLAARLESAALRGDAASSFTCAYMAGAVLLGVGLNAIFHWWWAEDVAALLFLIWLVAEAREAFKEVREDHEEEKG